MDLTDERKNIILTNLLRTLSGIGVLAYGPSVYFALADGFPLVAAADTVAYISIIVVAFLPRIGIKLKLAVLVLTCFFIAITVLFFTGAYGAGYIWLIAGIVLSALFGDRTTTIAAFIVSIVALAAYAVALQLGVPGKGFKPPHVLIVGTNLLVVCAALVIIIQRIQNDLMEVVEERKELADSLNVELTESKKIRGELAHALEEKEILVQELHHRVNNNMQIILSLIDLESKCEEAEIAMKRRIRALSAVNDLVIIDRNGDGAELSEVLRAAVDVALIDTFRGSRARTFVPAFQIVDAGLRPLFLSPQSAVMVALCVAELVSVRVDPLSAIRAVLAEKDNGVEIRFVFAAAEREESIAAGIQAIESGAIGEATAGTIAFRYLPPAADRATGPGVLLELSESLFLADRTDPVKREEA